MLSPLRSRVTPGCCEAAGLLSSLATTSGRGRRVLLGCWGLGDAAGCSLPRIVAPASASRQGHQGLGDQGPGQGMGCVPPPTPRNPGGAPGPPPASSSAHTSNWLGHPLPPPPRCPWEPCWDWGAPGPLWPLQAVMGVPASEETRRGCRTGRESCSARLLVAQERLSTAPAPAQAHLAPGLLLGQRGPACSGPATRSPVSPHRAASLAPTCWLVRGPRGSDQGTRLAPEMPVAVFGGRASMRGRWALPLRPPGTYMLYCPIVRDPPARLPCGANATAGAVKPKQPPSIHTSLVFHRENPRISE